mgnify:CR=1 FL=1
MKIVFLDRTSFPDWAEFQHDHLDWTNFDFTEPKAVVERARQADTLVTNKVVLDAEILAQLPRLKLVVVTATGTNNVDLVDCKRRGIGVANVSGYAANTVAEHILACLFGLRRNLAAYRTSIHQQEWSSSRHFCHFAAPISDIAGTTIGILGQGAIGSSLATKSRALGMRVITIDNREKKAADAETLQTALPQLDHLALCCPLTPDTADLIDAKALRLLPKHAVVINTSRGGIVNEPALVSALHKREIAGAACDVSVTEPMPANSPLYALVEYPNFILTPHVGWSSAQAIQALIAGVMKNIDDYMQGNTQHFLVPPAGRKH